MSSRDAAREVAPRKAPPRFSLPAARWAQAALAGLGGFVTILALAMAEAGVGTLLLIAPFGASCVLVFALPQSPLAQPRNVIGGHLISTAMGLCVLHLLGATPLGFALGVGLAIAAMSLTGTLHPPAGADPIVVMMVAAPWSFLIFPVLTGALTIVLMGIGFHRFVAGKPYPTP
ncbi:HPP family protein [Aquabacter sp. CN5-332]|uniref:HPP family protein n=1 Tax=Aquabacter sp. CN5-332 TaxID=3156608 RepID=UPI0032B5502C